MKKTLIITAVLFSTLSALAADVDFVIGKVKANMADQSCPVLITETQSNKVTCAKLDFVSLDLQIPVAKALSKQGILILSGVVEKRETGEGIDADILVVSSIGVMKE